MLGCDKLARRLSDQKFQTNTKFATINHIEAEQLSVSANGDAKALAHVAWVALAEGLSDASRKRFTWATVKLYYSSFQSIRVRLLLSGDVVFYRKSSPYSISARAGQTFKRRSGNTHTAVFKIFRENFPQAAILGQPIDGMNALEWIEAQRNDASYRRAPIGDPDVPIGFQGFKDKPRSAVQQYLDFSSGLAFDPAHAMVALPMLLLGEMSAEIERRLGASVVPLDKFNLDVLSSERLMVPEMSGSLRAFAFSP